MVKTHVKQRHGAGRSVRSEKLRVFAPLEGVPSSRAECRDGPRPCRYVRCEWHLWLQLGSDRPGRRVNGKPPATTVRAGWLEDPIPPSCGADFADAVAAGKHITIRQLADAVGLKPSRLRFILAVSTAKLRNGDTTLAEFVDDLEPAEVPRER